MNVQIISEEKIKPSAPTPHHLKTYKLSLLDQFAPSLYMPFIFFYPNNFVSNKDAAEILTGQLKESLSQVLAIYYPLAGRLKDCASVECSDEGVEFIEARATGSLSEFLKRPDIGAINNFLPCIGDVLEKGSNVNALVKVKVTVFDECGGTVIGVCVLHKIGDAGSAAVFLNSWAKISRGSNEKVEHPDFTFGSATFPARETLTNDFVTNFDNFFFQGTTSVMRRYVFGPAAIRTLKNKAAGEKVPNPTRVEALSAFVVKHMNAAVAANSDHPTTTLMITHAVNLRRRMEPPQPDNTFGNILWLAFAFYEMCNTTDNDDDDDDDAHRDQYSTDQLKINTVELVETLSEALVSLNEESLSELEADDAFTSLSEVMGSVCSSDKIKTYRFTSWCNLGFYDVNFGWGNPMWVAHMGNINMAGYRSKQQFVFIESPHNKGIELWLAADEQQISLLEKDPEFLAYATINPGICVD